MLSHVQLINCLDTLSFKIDSKGMCFGVTAMAIQAHLANDLESYARRLNLLSQFQIKELKTKLNEATLSLQKINDRVRVSIQKKLMNQYLGLNLKKNFESSLTQSQRREYYNVLSQAELKATADLPEHTQAILGIPAFFSGISIYQSPSLYSEFFMREKKFKTIIKSKKEPLLRMMDPDTIVLVEEGEMVIAYWLKDGNLVNRAFLASSLSVTIQATLRKMEENKIINNAEFIELITTRFKCDKGKLNTPSQSILATFPLLSPCNLTDIQKITSFSGIYNESELVQYFNLLSFYFAEHKINEPIALEIKSGNHALAICWDPIKKWSMVDVNRLYLLNAKFNDAELATYILKGFSKNSVTTFNTILYSKNPSSSPIENCIDALQKNEKWREIHRVTSKKATLEDSVGGSLLYVAIKNGQEDLVKALLELKADVHKSYRNGKTLLHQAVQNGDIGIVQQLLAAKIDVNKCLSNGVTPLHLAIQHSNVDIVKQLVEANADVNKCCKEGYSPLLYAAQTGEVEILKLLLEKNVALNVRSNMDVTPVYLAAQEGHLSFIKLLIEKKAVELSVPIDANVLKLKEFAAKMKRVEFEHFLKAKVRKETLGGFTPLHAAVFFGHVEIVKELLKAGVSPNLTADYNISLFDLAKAMGHTEITKILQGYRILSEFTLPLHCPFLKKLHTQSVEMNDTYFQAVEHYLTFKERVHQLQLMSDRYRGITHADFVGTLKIKLLEWRKDFIEAKDLNQEAIVINRIDLFIKTQCLMMKEKETNHFFKFFRKKKLSESLEEMIRNDELKM